MSDRQSELQKEFELERMILFSDAVFAIAITLLIIEIKFPEVSKNALQSPGKFQTMLHKYLQKNQSWAWIESTITNLKNHPGISGMVSNFRNVTDKVLLERQKDDFVGVATHELKTPVTSIKAYAQILLKRFEKKAMRHLQQRWKNGSAAQQTCRANNAKIDISEIKITDIP